MTTSLDPRAMGIAKPRTTDEPPYTATVVRSDTTGVWVVPIGADTRHPTGPCMGARRPDGTRLPAGTTVLLITTAAGPWVAAWEENI